MRDEEITSVLDPLREILAASPDAIVVADSGGVIRYANENVREVFGYAPEALEGSTIEQLLLQEDREDHVEYRQEYMRDPSPRPMGRELDLYARHESGESIPVEVSLAPLERGGEQYVVGTVTDITERKERERQLMESNERLEQFAYVASHDLQEPLRTVSNYLHILLEDHGEQLDDDARELIDIAVTGTERMESMIDALLDYSRVTTRGEAFDPVETGAVVESAVDSLQVLLDREDGTVEWGDLPRVEGDRDQLRQVFQNLVKNALEHSGGGPVHVEVRGEAGPDGHRFEVADDGPGIPRDMQEKVFRMFKSDKEYHTSSQAKGIGLAICENIVRRHGGEIWTEPEPDEGATIAFTIERNHNTGDNDD